MSKTPTLDKYRELESQHPLLATAFRASEANRTLMQQEQDAIDAAETAKTAKLEAKALDGKPHHLKVVELRERHPLLATMYESAHRFDLARETASPDSEPPPPPQAA